MNRVINLKKQSVSQPVSSSAPPSPVRQAPPLPPAPVQRQAPAPRPSVFRDDGSRALRWHYSSRVPSRVLWGSVTGLVITGAVLGFFGFYALAAILVLSGTVLVLQNRPDVLHEVELSDLGMRVDERIHFFKDIASFWIAYTPGGIKELSIQLRGWYLPYLTVPLQGKDPVRIREFLIAFVPEKEHPQSFVRLILHRLGL